MPPAGLLSEHAQMTTVKLCQFAHHSLSASQLQHQGSQLLLPPLSHYCFPLPLQAPVCGLELSCTFCQVNYLTTSHS